MDDLTRRAASMRLRHGELASGPSITGHDMTDEELALQIHLQDIEDQELAEAIAASQSDAPAYTSDTCPRDDDDDDDDDPMVESSSQAAARQDGTVKKAKCVACDHKIAWDSLAKAPCGHLYCGKCISKLFSHATRDESMFPPRCCTQKIALADVRALMNEKLAAEFEAKAVELSTPNRTYCYDPQCSTFIPPYSFVGDVGTCQRCRKTTCTMCKGKAHTGDCSQDVGLQQLLETAEGEGWRRCGVCRRMIAISTGCNHMTCTCGHQFCYVCGQRWKTCRCAHWEEARLYHRAEQLFNRNPALQMQPHQHLQAA